MSARKLPKIAPCPCPVPDCGRVIMPVGTGQFRVVAACGFAGPLRYSKRTAREAWNRRASEPVDREKLVRDGAMAALGYLDNCDGEPFAFAADALRLAIETGEVIPKREAKPEWLPKAKRGGRR